MQMKTANGYHRRRQLVWGLLLVGVGGAVLLGRMHFVDIDDLWHYWPLLLVAVGSNQTIGDPSAREFGKGLWLVFVGLWLFAVFEHAFGLTFRNSWPLLILAVGVKLIIDPFIARRLSSNQDPRHEN
jgi:hypothetical protein